VVHDCGGCWLLDVEKEKEEEEEKKKEVFYFFLWRFSFFFFISTYINYFMILCLTIACGSLLFKYEGCV